MFAANISGETGWQCSPGGLLQGPEYVVFNSGTVPQQEKQHLQQDDDQ